MRSSPTTPRLPHLAGQLQVRFEVHVAKLVVEQLEVVGVDRDIDGAALPLVDGEVPLDRQRLAVLVEDLELRARGSDPAAARSASSGRENARAGLRHGEGAVLKVDVAAQVRVGAGAGDV